MYTKLPQEVAHALVPALNVVKKMGSLERFGARFLVRKAKRYVPVLKRLVDPNPSLVREIVGGHALDNYEEKIGEAL